MADLDWSDWERSGRDAESQAQWDEMMRAELALRLELQAFNLKYENEPMWNEAQALLSKIEDHFNQWHTPLDDEV